MRIGIDGNEANQKNRVGIGQFAYNVICQLEKIDQKNSYLIYLKEPPLEDLPQEREGWNYRVFGPSNLWTQIVLPFKLFTQKEKLAVFYSPSHYAPRFSPTSTVISIMDLWHHRHPEQFTKKDLYRLTNWESYSVRKSSRIITISEFSKKEIVKFHQYPPEKITVAYPGFDNFQLKEKERRIKEIRGKHGIREEYLLYLGTLQPKKNIEGLIKAFEIVDRCWRLGVSEKEKISTTQPLTPITLVIAGKKGWLYENIFAEMEKLNLQEKVIFTDFITEEEKPYLISGAKAFVFPSFYEGFGIPVLEAMSLKVPVVASKEGSLPEVGGNAAIYCNPYDIDSIAKAMAEILNLNQNKRNEIIEKGLVQAGRFSWEKCAKTILKVLEETKNVEENR